MGMVASLSVADKEAVVAKDSLDANMYPRVRITGSYAHLDAVMDEEIRDTTKRVGDSEVPAPPVFKIIWTMPQGFEAVLQTLADEAAKLTYEIEHKDDKEKGPGPKLPAPILKPTWVIEMGWRHAEEKAFNEAMASFYAAEQIAIEQGKDAPEKPDQTWNFSEFWKGPLEKTAAEPKGDLNRQKSTSSVDLGKDGNATKSPSALDLGADTPDASASFEYVQEISLDQLPADAEVRFRVYATITQTIHKTEKIHKTPYSPVISFLTRSFVIERLPGGDKYAAHVRGPDIFQEEDGFYELKWGPGIYRIEAWGAKAGDSKDRKGGSGAFMGANFQMDEDKWLIHYRCGGPSRSHSEVPPEEEQALAFLEAGTGGGGATYVEVVDSVKKAGYRRPLKKHGVLLLAAGGGGGAGKDADGGHAVADAKQAAKGVGDSAGEGGKDGYGGKRSKHGNTGGLGGGGYLKPCEGWAGGNAPGGSFMETDGKSDDLHGFSGGGRLPGGGGAGYNGGGGGAAGGGGSSFVNYPSKEAEKPHAVRGSERRRTGAYEGHKDRGQILIQYLGPTNPGRSASFSGGKPRTPR